jgi:hypothetical protein
VNSGSRRRGSHAAIRIAAGLFALLVLATGACRRGGEPAGSPPPAPVTSRTDALFLAEAPAFVPEESESDLTAMGIARLYVVAATLGRDGRATPAPPPPSPLKRPIVLVLMGTEDAASALTGRGAEAGAEWARAISKVLADSKSWGKVAGVHVHLWPSSDQAKDLAAALSALKKAIGGARVSVTLPAAGEPTAWKPLVGAADEALVFAFGRRPELGGRIVNDLPEETAQVFPIPFRLLVAFGSYGRAGDGQTFAGRVLQDGKIDELLRGPRARLRIRPAGLLVGTGLGLYVQAAARRAVASFGGRRLGTLPDPDDGRVPSHALGRGAVGGARLSRARVHRGRRSEGRLPRRIRGGARPPDGQAPRAPPRRSRSRTPGRAGAGSRSP